MSRTTTTKPQAAEADPLADLREPEGATPPGPPAAPDVKPDPEPVDETHDALWHEDAATRITQAWHADTTSQGFAHKGGVCGCRYLARKALLAALGEPVEALPDVEDGNDG